MRVLHIGNEMLWRGGENQIRLLIEGLKNTASDVSNYLAYPAKSAAIEKFNAILPVGHVLRLPSRSGYDPRNAWRLVNFCRDNKIELINSHSSAGMSLALATKRRLPGIKLVAHRRVDIAIRENFFSRRKYASPLIDRFVCISNAIADVLKAGNVDAEKVRVVRSAVDESPYFNKSKDEMKRLISTKYQISRDTIWIGHAAALTWQKGFRELIQACEILKNKEVRFQCLVAGDGPFATEMRAMINSKGLSGRVHLLGHISNVSEFLLALDILAVPSHFEGLGTILLEGAFAGCALVGTRVGGIPEIIKDGETGLLVEKEQAGGLSAALQKVATDTNLRSALANSAKSYVRSQFSIRAMVEGNLKVYRELIGKLNLQSDGQK